MSTTSDAEKEAPKKKVSKKKVAKKTAKKAVKKTAKKTTARKKTTKKVQGISVPVGDYDLVIVESPSKAKTIKKYLGKGYSVVASNGHVKDLPKSKLGVDVKDNFTVDLVPITGKTNVLEKITVLAKNANNIYLAPDPDREGEAIAWHLAEEIGKRKKNLYRVLFNAVTKTAVQKAIENPTELDLQKYDSQRTRRILDRLVGYKISPILWDKVQRGLSAGRVQSVALRVIVEREDEIDAFIPEQWFSVHAIMQKAGLNFEAKYFGDINAKKKIELTDVEQVKKILADTANRDFTVKEVKKKERRQNPTPPFTTSKLQQEAVNKLGFSTKKTMMLAQRLYEGVNLTGEGLQGLITYMRTDSVRTEPEAIEAVRELIGEQYGKEYLPESAHIYKKKGKGKVQDAHESIRPTNLQFSPEKVKGDLEPDQFKLYSLIWNKFLSSQMSQAVIDQTTVNFEVNGHIFRSNGSIIKFPGFRKVYLDSKAEKAKAAKNDEESDDDKISKGELPPIEEKETLTPKKFPFSEEHWTSPPPRFNEASIVKELEEKGIGRPSTYASIISNILDRGYVEKIENRLVPTELGKVVCKMLVESFPNEMDVEFTARVEEQLDQIEEGDVKFTKVLKEFWKSFEVTLEKAKEEMKNLKKQEIPTGLSCKKCSDGEYLIKWGRNGQFLACSNYPDCTSTQDFKKHLDGTLEILPKNYFRDPCPTCNSKLIVKTGRYGRFVVCEEYPKCDTTLPYTLEEGCPKCKVGNFAEKKSRYGKFFYGCSNYPNCDFAMWTRPREFDCPGCGFPVMGQRETKRLGHHLQCPECKHIVDLDETPFAIKEESEQV